MNSKRIIATLALSMAALGLVSCNAKTKNNNGDPTPVVTTKYTVSFVTNGGTSINSMEVEAGSTLSSISPTTSISGRSNL